MIVCISVQPDGTVAPGWGRARRVAVASVNEGRIDGWEEHDVRWDVLHDEGTEGAHHARVVRFLQEHRAQVVVTGRLGQGMARTIRSMGLHLEEAAAGDARSAALAVCAGLTASTS